MTALKVKDLPQEQREQLLNEAKEKGININFCMGWTVDTLKDKIAATVAKNENGDEAKAEETPAEETKADEAKAEETPAEETKADEAKADEAKAEETPAEETKADEAKADEAKAEETPAEETKTDEAKAPANTQKAYICHICRSKVIDGKCTGCGYSLK